MVAVMATKLAFVEIHRNDTRWMSVQFALASFFEVRASEEAMSKERARERGPYYIDIYGVHAVSCR